VERAVHFERYFVSPGDREHSIDVVGVSRPALARLCPRRQRPSRKQVVGDAETVEIDFGNRPDCWNDEGAAAVDDERGPS
jgi:hypothetical protein